MNRVLLVSNPEREILKTTRQSNGRNWEECCQQDYPKDVSHWILHDSRPASVIAWWLGAAAVIGADITRIFQVVERPCWLPLLATGDDTE